MGSEPLCLYYFNKLTTLDVGLNSLTTISGLGATMSKFFEDRIFWTGAISALDARYTLFQLCAHNL